MGETYSDNSLDEFKLASVVQLIGVIDVVTEPGSGSLSIDVVGVGQGRGR